MAITRVEAFPTGESTDVVAACGRLYTITHDHGGTEQIRLNSHEAHIMADKARQMRPYYWVQDADGMLIEWDAYMAKYAAPLQ